MRLGGALSGPAARTWIMPGLQAAKWVADKGYAGGGGGWG